MPLEGLFSTNSYSYSYSYSYSLHLMKPFFDHERLEVYGKAIEFVADSCKILDQIPKSSALWAQLDRASVSIPLNIAEGNGKWSPRDRCRFFDIAHGSALESAATLEVSVAKGILTEKEASAGKAALAEIVRMLIGLIKANDPQRRFGNERRVRENPETDNGEEEEDYEYE